MRVLVVDDEPAVRDSLLRALRFEGYDPTGVGDGMQALDALEDGGYDAVVLDVMMPRLSGVETCRRMRARGDTTPVLMLTARDDVPSRVAGLDAGADDYLAKPFALEELLARVRALLRRGATAADEEEVLRLADLELHPARRVAVRGGAEIALTRTEFDLLEQLLRHRGRVLTRSVLFEQVWGHDFGATSNTLDVYIGYVRRKTEAGGAPRLVHTVRGVGFVAREPT